MGGPGGSGSRCPRRRPAGRTPSGSGTSNETSVEAPARRDRHAAVAQQPGEQLGAGQAARSCTWSKPASSSTSSEACAHSTWCGAREAGGEPAGVRLERRHERLLRPLERVVAAPRRRAGSARAPGSRTGSRSRPGRRATSGPRRRRSRSRARGRRPARRRGPARRRAPRARPTPRAARCPSRARSPMRRASVTTSRVWSRSSSGSSSNGTTRTRHPARVARGRERREHAGVLLVARDDLVAGLRSSACSTALMPSVVEPVRATSDSVGAEQSGGAPAQLVDPLDLVLEPRLAAAALLELLAQRRLGRLERAQRHRPVRAGVHVGDPLEDGELGSELLHAGRILGSGRP